MKPDVLDWLASQLTPADLSELTKRVMGRLPVEPPPVPTPPAPQPPSNGPLFRIPNVAHRYATIDPWNSDKRVMVLQHPGGQVGLHHGDGKLFKMLPAVNHSSEIVWGADPNVFYFVDGNSVRKFDIGKPWDAAISTVRNFPEYVTHDPDGRNGVRAMGEGDLMNGRQWALAGTLPSGETQVFCFDVLTGTAGDRLKLAGVDGLYRTPDGNLLVTYYLHGKDRFNGVELFDANMQFIRQVVDAFGHMDVGRDQDGDECIVWCNSASRDNPVCQNGAVIVKLKEPKNQKCIHSFDWDIAMHISCSNRPGESLISTFVPNQPNSRKPYANDILLTVSNLAFAIGKHGSNVQAYEQQPKAAISKDGTRYCYTSNNDTVIGTL